MCLQQGEAGKAGRPGERGPAGPQVSDSHWGQRSGDGQPKRKPKFMRNLLVSIYTTCWCQSCCDIFFWSMKYTFYSACSVYPGHILPSKYMLHLHVFKLNYWHLSWFFLCRVLVDSLAPLDFQASRDTEWVWRTLKIKWLLLNSCESWLSLKCSLIFFVGIQRSRWSQGRCWTCWPQGKKALLSKVQVSS